VIEKRATVGPLAERGRETMAAVDQLVSGYRDAQGLIAGSSELPGG
jgi:hypothetical protein